MENVNKSKFLQQIVLSNRYNIYSFVDNRFIYKIYIPLNVFNRYTNNLLST